MEVERRPGVAITAASLPGVSITPFHISQDDLPTPDSPPESWEDLIGVPAREDPSLILLPDPLSVEADRLITGLDYAYPKSPKIGGLASGGSQATPHALFIAATSHRSAAVGVAPARDQHADITAAPSRPPVAHPLAGADAGSAYKGGAGRIRLRRGRGRGVHRRRRGELRRDFSRCSTIAANGAQICAGGQRIDITLFSEILTFWKASKTSP